MLLDLSLGVESMSNPISVKHRHEFIRWMVEHEIDVGEDEWTLLHAAEEFLILKKLQRGNPLDAVKFYKTWRDSE